MPDDDVIVPKDVEKRIRALHPPDQHEDKIEEARTYYRVLREDRKKELADARTVSQIDPPPVRPTAVQQEAIAARRRKKAPRRRKVLVYPQPGSATRPPGSTHEQGLWQRHLDRKAFADRRDAERSSTSKGGADKVLVAKADYAHQLRQEADSRRVSARWAKQHPEWVETHKRISARTPQDIKAEAGAGRKKVPKEKMLVPIRADKGTQPPREKKPKKKLRWLWQR